MQINLSGHHIEITDPLRDFVNGKFAKLERHFEQINKIGEDQLADMAARRGMDIEELRRFLAPNLG